MAWLSFSEKMKIRLLVFEEPQTQQTDGQTSHDRPRLRTALRGNYAKNFLALFFLWAQCRTERNVDISVADLYVVNDDMSVSDLTESVAAVILSSFTCQHETFQSLQIHNPEKYEKYRDLEI